MTNASWQFVQISEEGCSLHQILPRTLEHLSRGNPPNAKARRFEQAFDAVGLTIDRDDEEREATTNGQDQDLDWLEKLLKLETANDNDSDRELSFAEINQKRKRLTFAAFQEADFLEKILVLNNLMGPNVDAMHQLFHRTGAIGKLTYIPHEAPSTDTDDSTKLVKLAAQFLALLEDVANIFQTNCF